MEQMTYTDIAVLCGAITFMGVWVIVAIYALGRFIDWMASQPEQD